jgi:hypothetical protein
MAFGTPGGDSQDQWCLQFFVNVVDRGMNLQAAIDAPRMRWMFGGLRSLEPGHPLGGRFPDDVGRSVVPPQSHANGRLGSGSLSIAHLLCASAAQPLPPE